MYLEFNNVHLLCNFDGQYTGDDAIINKLWSGKWTIEDIELCQELLSTELETELVINIINRAKEQGFDINRFLYLAISSFLTFCERNWNQHPEKLNLEQFLGIKWPENVDARLKLERNSEPVFANILYPELLHLSTQLFDALCTVEDDLVYLWWSFRAKVVHQRAIESISETIYSELELLIEKLSKQLPVLNSKQRLQMLLCLEIAQAFLIYTKLHKVEEFLLKASDFLESKLDVTGVLGKKTNYQELLQIEIDDDDETLHKIKFNEQISQADLSIVEQILCLLTVQFIQKSQSSDLRLEELQGCIEAILSKKNGPWSARVAGLLTRCKMEAEHKGTAERALLQCEGILNDKTAVTPTCRLECVWASGLQPSWMCRRQLADMRVALGQLETAAHHYQELDLWEDVVACYTALESRHKAAEALQQQIEIKPTVKLYCLLGDVTEEVRCYEQAWELSQRQSSRAQRHWADFLFSREEYEECIPHYVTSLQINSLQGSNWMRMGYAAVKTGQWEKSVKAYSRLACIQPYTSEAWVNLAKVYLDKGDKSLAYKTLMKAIQFHSDNSEIWENVIAVSIDIGHYKDVARGINHMLYLRHEYQDLEVLSLLVRAVGEDKKDADGIRTSRLQRRMMELFSRITAIHQDVPEIWQLYSDLCSTNLMKAQKLLQAYTALTQSGSWSSDPETCRKAVDLVQALLECSVKARKEAEGRDVIKCDQQLSSARETARRVVDAVERQHGPETAASLDKLKTLCELK